MELPVVSMYSSRVARFILATFFCLSLITLYGQEEKPQTVSIEGRVLTDVEPVPYAHVYLENSRMGTVTNSTGDFILRIPISNDPKKTTIIISAIGFTSEHILLQNLTKENVVIHLVPAILELKEIIVEAKIDSSIIVLNKAIKKIKTNYPRKRHLIEAFYRELSIKDTVYTRLIEAAVLVDEPAYKGNTVDSDDLSLERNRVKVIEMRKSEDHRDYDLLGWAFTKMFGEKNDIYEILNDNYVRFIGKSNDHFLSKKILNEYDIEITEVTSYENNPVVVMRLTSKNKDIFFLRDIKIYIHQSDYGILKIENNLIVNPVRTEIAKFAIDQKYFYQSMVTYQKVEDVYIPYYIHTKKYASNTNPLSNNTLQYSDIEYLITHFFYNDYERIRPKYALKKGNDINNSETVYNETFWNNYNTVILNPISNKAKKDLEKERSLNNQFKKN